jgi:N-methylhydantoinase B/oxoprolinase/acetone carboxylase alpha subunit
MEYAVRYQHEQYSGKLKPGDHILTNHPLAGGTHLPDITIVTPVWDKGGTRIIFYVASRGHHGKSSTPTNIISTLQQCNRPTNHQSQPKSAA